MNKEKWNTYRRIILNSLQEKYKSLYNGIVLDIGGRDRGIFKELKLKVDKWIFADIDGSRHPDIIIDVSNMEYFNSNSIDVINALELFEHVFKIRKGLKECYRVLKKDGKLILSTPFLFPIHGLPYDYQRWTYNKWRFELEKVGFKIEKMIIMGNFFTIFADMLKTLLKSQIKRSSFKRKIFSLFLPLLDNLTKFDNRKLLKNNDSLKNFHYGYFIISTKV